MLRCRKNQATLTAAEKSHFVAAVLALKANGTYDKYVDDHRNFMSSAHRGPAFLPWHREFLRRFELDLQAINSSVTLPYWDWTVDNSPISSLWADDFMGGNGRPTDGRVMSGPFAFSTGNWTLAVDGPALRRRFGVSIPTLPTPSDVTNALATVPYDLPPYNDSPSLAGFRNTVEGWRNGPQLHNRVHVWVGGSMLPASSPNDPVFFLNHCFEDKLWADWQRMHPTESYLPVSGGPAGHNLTDAMEPWASRGQTVTPASVLDHHALGYAYDTETVCAPKLKFIDDPGRIKKILDDPPKRKFIDDPVVKKPLDDPKFKFIDDPVIPKRIGDVKIAGSDTRPIDPLIPRTLAQNLGVAGGTPFILATPHHSMAWAGGAQAAGQEVDAAQYEAAIAQYEVQLTELQQRLQQGVRELVAIDQQYQSMLAEYQILTAEYQRMRLQR
jgi:tyrosinase